MEEISSPETQIGNRTLDKSNTDKPSGTPDTPVVNGFNREQGDERENADLAQALGQLNRLKQFELAQNKTPGLSQQVIHWQSELNGRLSQKGILSQFFEWIRELFASIFTKKNE